MYFLLEKKDGCGYIHPYTWEEEKEDPIDPEAIHSCLVEKKDHDLFGTDAGALAGGEKVEGKKADCAAVGTGTCLSKFAFVVWEDGIRFADFDGYLQGIMDRLRKENGKKTPEAMLYRLFQILLKMIFMCWMSYTNNWQLWKKKIPRIMPAFSCKKCIP